VEHNREQTSPPTSPHADSPPSRLTPRSGAEHEPVTPVLPRGLANGVAQWIRETILNGGFPPGTQLREAEVARRLDVSRGPVREALLRLEREGLVQTQWHRGATVTTLSNEDGEELTSLRAALDGVAVPLVVAGGDPAALAAAETAVAEMATTTNEYTMAGLDIGFHDAVYAAAGHRRLEAAWRAIRAQIYLYLVTRIGQRRDEYLHEAAAEHQRLLAALRGNDVEHAMRLFSEHHARLVGNVPAGR
jgi:DNA-binding GntR family transcriptional regulator